MSEDRKRVGQEMGIGSDMCDCCWDLPFPPSNCLPNSALSQPCYPHKPPFHLLIWTSGPSEQYWHMHRASDCFHWKLHCMHWPCNFCTIAGSWGRVDHEIRRDKWPVMAYECLKAPPCQKFIWQANSNANIAICLCVCMWVSEKERINMCVRIKICVCVWGGGGMQRGTTVLLLPYFNFLF